MAYRRPSYATVFSDDSTMTSIRVKLSRITAKKVPALTLIVVGLVGMVAGVLAATVTVTQNNYNGETGTYHNTTAGFTVTDNGLAVTSNGGSANYANNTQIAASGTQTFNGNTVNAGDWVESITITQGTLSDGSSHRVNVTIRDGTGTVGTPIATFGSTSTFIKAPSATGATGSVTVYFDLGTSVTTPITVYVNIA